MHTRVCAAPHSPANQVLSCSSCLISAVTPEARGSVPGNLCHGRQSRRHNITSRSTSLLDSYSLTCLALFVSLRCLCIKEIYSGLNKGSMNKSTAHSEAQEPPSSRFSGPSSSDILDNMCYGQPILQPPWCWLFVKLGLASPPAGTPPEAKAFIYLLDSQFHITSPT